MKYTIVSGKREHVFELAQTIRAENRAEVEVDGESALSALIRTAQSSIYWKTAISEDGRVICSWGLCPISIFSGVATVWLFSSDLVEKIPVSFVKDTIRETRTMNSLFPRILNFVDTRYIQACNWLERTGFKKGIETTTHGVVFREYYKDAE